MKGGAGVERGIPRNVRSARVLLVDVRIERVLPYNSKEE